LHADKAYSVSLICNEFLEQVLLFIVVIWDSARR